MEQMMFQDDNGEINWVKVVVAYLLFKAVLLVAVYFATG